MHNPGFAAYAKLCGAKGVRVTDSGKLAEVLSEASRHEGPALVAIIADAELI